MSNFILFLYYFIRKVHIQVVEYKANATTKISFWKLLVKKELLYFAKYDFIVHFSDYVSYSANELLLCVFKVSEHPQKQKL